METLFITVFVFALVIVGMAIGVIFSNKALKGTCGGLNKLFGKGFCDICEHKEKCEKEEPAN